MRLLDAASNDALELLADAARHAAHVGAAAFLAKPFNLDDPLTLVGRILPGK